jgi:predicted transcriptional regulator
MRPPGTSEQLVKRRQKALNLLESGKAIPKIASQLGTTERSVRHWREEAKHPKKKASEDLGKKRTCRSSRSKSWNGNC